MTEFYFESDNNPHDMSSLNYWNQKLSNINGILDQIRIEIKDCNKRLNELSNNKELFLTNKEKTLFNYDSNKFSSLFDINFTIDDVLMEIDSDFFNEILNSDKRIYSINSVELILEIVKLFIEEKDKTDFDKINKHSNKAYDYKVSLENVSSFIQSKSINIVDILFSNYNKIVDQYIPTEEDFIYLQKIINDINDYKAQYSKLEVLINLLHIVIIESYKSKLNLSPELIELKNDLNYLQELNKEKEEELRRSMIIFSSLKEEEANN